MKIHISGFVAIIVLSCTLLLAAPAVPQQASGKSPAGSASEIPSSQLIQPEELATLLRSSKSPKPLVFQVGFRVLYVQAHIPGSEYVAAGSSAEGLQQLRSRVEKLPRNTAIVLYCGCCPWSHCPNVKPAYQELHSQGFTDLKVLYVAHDFGTDWVNKGYPVEKGQ